MKVLFDPSVFEDPKIKTTLDLLSKGYTKDEIVKHFNHKDWRSIYMYFSRRGFRWDGNTFVPMEDDLGLDDSKLQLTKAAKIVRQLEQQYVDITYVALRNGFASVAEMGEYMKSQGYEWNSELNNYLYNENFIQERKQEASVLSASFINSSNISGEYEELLKYLLSKQNKLMALLEQESDGTLPRYKFRGAKVNKTLGLPTSLQTLLSDFSDEYNVTQRAIIEIALAEFFKKYGYEEQLKQSLQL